MSYKRKGYIKLNFSLPETEMMQNLFTAVQYRSPARKTGRQPHESIYMRVSESRFEMFAVLKEKITLGMASPFRTTLVKFFHPTQGGNPPNSV